MRDAGILGHSPPIWPLISTQTLLGSRWCIGMGNVEKKYSVLATLPGWLTTSFLVYQEPQLVGSPCWQLWSVVNFWRSQWRTRSINYIGLPGDRDWYRLIANEITTGQTSQTTVRHSRIGGTLFMQKMPTSIPLRSLEPHSNGSMPRSNIPPSHDWLSVKGSASRSFH